MLTTMSRVHSSLASRQSPSSRRGPPSICLSRANLDLVRSVPRPTHRIVIAHPVYEMTTYTIFVAGTAAGPRRSCLDLGNIDAGVFHAVVFRPPAHGPPA